MTGDVGKSEEARRTARARWPVARFALGTVAFIGRAALLKNTETTGRPQDVADIARLRETGRADRR